MDESVYPLKEWIAAISNVIICLVHFRRNVTFLWPARWLAHCVFLDAISSSSRMLSKICCKNVVFNLCIVTIIALYLFSLCLSQSRSLSCLLWLVLFWSAVWSVFCNLNRFVASFSDALFFVFIQYETGDATQRIFTEIDLSSTILTILNQKWTIY